MRQSGALVVSPGRVLAASPGGLAVLQGAVHRGFVVVHDGPQMYGSFPYIRNYLDALQYTLLQSLKQ